MPHLLGERFGVPLIFRRGAGQHLASPHTFRFQSGQAACVNGFGHQGAGDAEVERQLAHPFSRPLGARGVQNHVDEIIARQLILDAQNVAG